MGWVVYCTWYVCEKEKLKKKGGVGGGLGLGATDGFIRASYEMNG